MEYKLLNRSHFIPGVEDIASLRDNYNLHDLWEDLEIKTSLLYCFGGKGAADSISSALRSSRLRPPADNQNWRSLRPLTAEICLLNANRLYKQLNICVSNLPLNSCQLGWM